MNLKDFATELNTFVKPLGMRIVVIRNYEGLPEENIGNDIDIIIRTNDLTSWLSVLLVISLARATMASISVF